MWVILAGSKWEMIHFSVWRMGLGGCLFLDHLHRPLKTHYQGIKIEALGSVRERLQWWISVSGEGKEDCMHVYQYNNLFGLTVSRKGKRCICSKMQTGTWTELKFALANSLYIYYGDMHSRVCLALTTGGFLFTIQIFICYSHMIKQL